MYGKISHSETKLLRVFFKRKSRFKLMSEHWNN